jgi:hypothetical protein
MNLIVKGNTEILEVRLCKRINEILITGVDEFIKNECSNILNKIILKNMNNKCEKDENFKMKYELLDYSIRTIDYYKKEIFDELIHFLDMNNVTNVNLATNRSISTWRFGKYFEIFILDLIKNSNDIKVLSQQECKTDAILEFEGEKVILEIKSGESAQCVKSQVSRYKENTNISRAITINADYKYNLDFSKTYVIKRVYKLMNEDFLNSLIDIEIAINEIKKDEFLLNQIHADIDSIEDLDDLFIK